jgi:hypothetical protein
MVTYFSINGENFSPYVNKLVVTKQANYNAQTNAAGNTVVDYINTKRTIEVGIIPVDEEVMEWLQQAISGFSVEISFLNPQTKDLEEDILCIIPEDKVEYYTIQSNKTLFKAFNLTFTEL